MPNGEDPEAAVPPSSPIHMIYEVRLVVPPQADGGSVAGSLQRAADRLAQLMTWQSKWHWQSHSGGSVNSQCILACGACEPGCPPLLTS